jgi:hypothetical protein
MMSAPTCLGTTIVLVAACWTKACTTSLACSLWISVEWLSCLLTFSILFSTLLDLSRALNPNQYGVSLFWLLLLWT